MVDAMQVGKVNQMQCCDWLPEQARWCHLAHSRLPTVSRKKNFPESHIINILLPKLVWSRRLNSILILFFFFFFFFCCKLIGLCLHFIPLTWKNKTWPYISKLDPYISNEQPLKSFWEGRSYCPLNTTLPQSAGEGKGGVAETKEKKLKCPKAFD